MVAGGNHRLEIKLTPLAKRLRRPWSGLGLGVGVGLGLGLGLGLGSGFGLGLG
jgi:hypothetical protein